LGYTAPVVPPALLLYRALIATALPVAAPWLILQARRRGKRRPSLASRLWRNPPPLPAGGAWIHAVSVGEVGVARVLLAEMRRRLPHVSLILSATTATGLATAASHDSADAVVPLPLDLPGPVRRALETARPRLVVLVETELWPELLHACRSRTIPVVIANARISDRSFAGYRRCRPLLAPLLAPITRALAQSEEDARRLVAIGLPPERVRAVGNVKFDSPPPSELPPVAAAIRRVAAGRPILAAGSTMEGEDELVLEAVARLPVSNRPFLLLAPRHPERAPQVAERVAGWGLSCALRTRLEAVEGPLDVVVLDSVGELASLYALAAVAFVGGSLVPTGGHNPIEPARFGVPIVTGPHVRNFAAVYREFTSHGAARVVRTTSELTDLLARWFGDPAAAREVGQAAAAILARNAGATAAVVDELERFLRP